MKLETPDFETPQQLKVLHSECVVAASNQQSYSHVLAPTFLSKNRVLIAISLRFDPSKLLPSLKVVCRPCNLPSSFCSVLALKPAPCPSVKCVLKGA